MKFANREKVFCKCGLTLRRGAWLSHIRGTKRPCSADSKWRLRAVEILLFAKTKGRCAWRKSEGTEALGVEGWFVDVVMNKASIDEWSFVRPRPVGQIRESAISSYKLNRKGVNNPSMKKEGQIAK